MDKLKNRWGVSSNWQLLVIFFVFSVTGSSAVFLAKPVLESLGILRDGFHSSFWLGALPYYFFRILLIFPIYQILLVLYGWIFGQFRFFWNFEKKMLKRIGLKNLFSD